MVVYFPVLKNSTAEMNALQTLKEGTKQGIIPIIESKNIKKGNVDEWWPTFRTLGSYFSEKLNGMKFIYDFHSAFDKIGEVSELIKSPEEKNVVEYCIMKLKDAGLDFIPCVHFDSPDWVINSVLEYDNPQIAIRIRCHDFSSTMEELVIERINDKLINRVEEKKFFVILDFSNAAINEDRILESVNKFMKLDNSTIVLALTNCPEDASKANPLSFDVVEERFDFKTFKTVKEKFPEICFGDYTVRLKPELERGGNIDYYNTYLKIFYSTEEDYMVGKSSLLGDKGISTFVSVCQEIVDSDVYKTSDFSAGDKAIKDCAEGTLVISNHQKPIEYGINHHIELVVFQLSPVLTGF